MSHRPPSLPVGRCRAVTRSPSRTRDPEIGLEKARGPRQPRHRSDGIPLAVWALSTPLPSCESVTNGWDSLVGSVRRRSPRTGLVIRTRRLARGLLACSGLLPERAESGAHKAPPGWGVGSGSLRLGLPSAVGARMHARRNSNPSLVKGTNTLDS